MSHSSSHQLAVRLDEIVIQLSATHMYMLSTCRSVPDFDMVLAKPISTIDNLAVFSGEFFRCFNRQMLIGRNAGLQSTAFSARTNHFDLNSLSILLRATERWNALWEVTTQGKRPDQVTPASLLKYAAEICRLVRAVIRTAQAGDRSCSCGCRNRFVYRASRVHLAAGISVTWANSEILQLVNQRDFLFVGEEMREALLYLVHPGFAYRA